MPKAAKKAPPRKKTRKPATRPVLSVAAQRNADRTNRIHKLEGLAVKALGPKARVTGWKLGERTLVRAAVNDGSNILIDMPNEHTALRQLRGALEGIIRSASEPDDA